ncbi:MAG: lipocalin-like domain-containing protein [Rhodopila sp.]
MVSQSVICRMTSTAVVLAGLGMSSAGAQIRPDSMACAATADTSVVGTWELVSLSWTTPDGRSVLPWGNAPGRLTYDSNGNMMGIIMHERRSVAQIGSTADPETQSQFSAYFGTYRIDTANGLIVHSVTGSLNGANASGELRRSFKMEDGMLVLGFTVDRDGVPVTRRLVWKRISTPCVK